MNQTQTPNASQIQPNPSFTELHQSDNVQFCLKYFDDKNYRDNEMKYWEENKKKWEVETQQKLKIKYDSEIENQKKNLDK